MVAGSGMALEGGAVIDFTQAFSYPFRDAHWPVKLAVMGLIVMVPVLGVVVLTGWMILIRSGPEIRRRGCNLPSACPALERAFLLDGRRHAGLR
jgi:hypothetical protein